MKYYLNCVVRFSFILTVFYSIQTVTLWDAVTCQLLQTLTHANTDQIRYTDILAAMYCCCICLFLCDILLNWFRLPWISTIAPISCRICPYPYVSSSNSSNTRDSLRRLRKQRGSPQDPVEVKSTPGTEATHDVIMYKETPDNARERDLN